MAPNEFPPSRQRGIFIHVIAILVLSAIGLAAFGLVFQTPVGVLFALYLVLFLAVALPVPVLVYRLYALIRANYLLDRNTLRLVWGLRAEDIPVADVEWVRPVTGLLAPLSLPWFRLPGGILGVTRQADIGDVEFLASEADTLLLVATARRVFAISPADPAAFASAFQKVIEMGSLLPGEGRSQYPSFVVVQAWESVLVRYLWLVGVFLNIGTLIWVSVLVPTVSRIPLGFGPDGLPLEPVPGVQLVLVPFMSAVLFIMGWLLGLFFYRREDQRVLALAIWTSSTLAALLFLLAVFFIVTTPI